MGCGKVEIKPGDTRKSCLDCVEKHLGAAAVLLTEVREGYPHRLLAIGHLHEAAEEAQAWPELDREIRAARKKYQANGTIPDFAALELMIRAIRSPRPKPTIAGPVVVPKGALHVPALTQKKA